MKRFTIFFIIITFLAFTKGFADEIIPPCLDGFTQMSTTVNVGPSPYCTYTVYFCFKCNVEEKPWGYVYEFEFGGIVYAKPPSEFCKKPYGDVEAAALAKILDPDFIDDYLCGPTGWDVPPCIDPEFEIIVVVNTKLCKVKYKDPECDVPVVLDCPNKTLECHRVWKICWNGSNYEYTIIEGPTMRNGDPYECNIYRPPQYPYYEPSDPSDGNYSDCFRVWGTPCTPYPPGEE